MTIASALLAALETVTVQNGLSSAHITFLTAREVDAAEARGWLRRDGLQFHWLNRGYSSFDDFLAALSSRKRKAIRKERAAAVEGLEIVALRGAEIEPGALGRDVALLSGHRRAQMGPALSDAGLLRRVGEAMGDSALMFLALRRWPADRRRAQLHWRATRSTAAIGARSRNVPFLHFELSYYRAIDWAIAHGLRAIQAGAQGEHKLARGYEPVITPSVHFLPDPGFRSAVADFLVRRARSGSRWSWNGRAAALALPLRFLVVDRDLAPVRSGHAAIHARRGESPGRFA